MVKQHKTKDYETSVHFYGRLWMAAAFVIMLSVPIAISVYYDAWPGIPNCF